MKKKSKKILICEFESFSIKYENFNYQQCTYSVQKKKDKNAVFLFAVF